MHLVLQIRARIFHLFFFLHNYCTIDLKQFSTSIVSCVRRKASMIDCNFSSIINKSFIMGKKDAYLYTPSLLRQFYPKKKYIATRCLIQDVCRKTMYANMYNNIFLYILYNDIFLSRIKLLQTKCGVRENTFLTRYISTSIQSYIGVCILLSRYLTPSTISIRRRTAPNCCTNLYLFEEMQFRQ